MSLQQLLKAKDLLTANLSWKPEKATIDTHFIKLLWIMVGLNKSGFRCFSHKMKEKKEKTLKNMFDKEIDKARKSLKKLKGTGFLLRGRPLKAAETCILNISLRLYLIKKS